MNINTTIKAFCKKHGITEDQFYGREEFGGSLDLRSLTSIPEGFNPTVGGSLDLRSLTSIPKGFNPTDLPRPQYPLIYNGCILADGILKRLIHQRGNNYKLRDLVGTDVSYLVSDGNGVFAHGETLKKAKEDLQYKISADKLKKEPIRADTIVTMQHYRIITGACESGCREWMRSNGVTVDRMRADELMVLLERSNAYGVNAFKELLTSS